MKYTSTIMRKLMAIAFAIPISVGLAQAQWNRTFNNSNNDIGLSVATDSVGSCFVTGRTSTASGDDDIITLRYNASGTLMWSRVYLNPAGSQDRGEKVLVDSAGNVFVGGLVSSGSGPGMFGYAVIKYNRKGNLLWDRQFFGPELWYEFSDMALDVSGNVIVTGVVEKPSQYSHFWTVKYDTRGNLQWGREYSGNSNSTGPSAVSTDSEGNVVVVGRSVDSTNVGEITTVKYDPSGTQMWDRRLMRNGNNGAASVAIDAGNNIYVGATLWTLVKYTPEGIRLWTKSFADPQQTDPRIVGIKADAAGTLAIAGTVIAANGERDWVTSRYDTDGNLLWNRYFDGTLHAEDLPRALTLDSQGNAIVTGYENQGSDATRVNIVAIKYSFGGTALWTRRKGAGDNLEQISVSVAVDPWDNVFITGWVLQPGLRGDDIFTCKMPP